MRERFLLAVLALPLVAAIQAQQPQQAAGWPQGPSIQSPEILPDGRVSFRLQAPEARAVAVRNTTGGWAEWPQTGDIAMAKDEKGMWSATVGPVKPEFYTYVFVVDGLTVLDPRNNIVSRDGMRFSSALEMDGGLATNYRVNAVPHGTVAAVWYASPALGMTRRATIYTPPGYEASGAVRYPVFYLLHGGGNDEEEWATLGRVPEILDNLIAAGKAKPMIVVMPNGNALQQAAPDFVASKPGVPFTQILRFPESLVSDLIPFVDKTYRTEADRGHRAVAGLSMGGAQTLVAAFNHLDQFAWVGALSAGLPLLPGVPVEIPAPANAARLRGPDVTKTIDPAKLAALTPQLNAGANEKLKLFYVTIGTEDGLISAHNAFKAMLKEKNVKAAIVEVPGYGHEWAFWRVAITDLAPRLFQ